MVGGEEGLDILEEFYTDEANSEQYQQIHDLSHVQDIQKGLQQSVQELLHSEIILLNQTLRTALCNETS